MMTVTSRVLLVLLSTLSLLVHLADAQSGTVTLQVNGHSNATPWVAALGETVAVAWGATADAKSDVFLAMSSDGGRTFDTPRRVNTIIGEARLGGELPPRVELRARPGQGPEVVVLWTARGERTAIKLSRSLDGGRSFTAPVTLQASDAAGDRGWAALALDGSGTAHALWLDHRDLAARSGATAHAEHKQAAAHDGALMAQRSGLYYASSGGVPANENRLTTGVCYCCKTALATGPGGELYAAWRHVYPGNLRDIAFTVSRDAGKTFAPHVRGSEDRWHLNGCPDDGPAIAVGASGTVHLVWPTVLTEAEPEGALFYSSTRDGRTFTPRMRVPTQGSPKPSHPQILVEADGRITIAWDEVNAGKREAFARTATDAGAGTLSFGAPITLDDGGSAMYPVWPRAAEAALLSGPRVRRARQ